MIDDAERARLFGMFPPRYENRKATHVTLAIDPEFEFPVDAQCEIVGYATDDAGVECFVVRVDGNIERPDGAIFHVTWSISDGRAAKESNDVIAEYGYTPIEPVRFVTRAFFSPGENYITTPLTGDF